jgi:ParB family chromosome partitioning protein
MAALSRHVGVSKATITRCMSYFKLPEGVLEILEGQPRIIGTRAVADFAAFEKQHDDLVVEGISMIVDGKTSQQGSLRWIKRQIQNRINPAGPKPTPNHLVANGEVLGRIKVKGNCVEIVCESGVNVSNLADLLKELLSTQTIPKGEPLPE